MPLRRRILPHRSIGAKAALLVGVLLLAIVLVFYRADGQILRTWDFSPQASEGRPDLAWSLLRTNNGPPLLWCANPSESISAPFEHRRRGVVEVWVAGRMGKDRPLELEAMQGGHK